jgi:HEAT repeat protein
MLRLLVASWCTLALTASASGRRPASALGDPKEDEPAPPGAALSVPVAKCSADLAFTRAVLFAFQPAPTEIRVLAVEDLGLLGDPRALNLLAPLLFDLNPAVQAAALRAVSAFASSRAEEILSNVLRHPLVSEALKRQAIPALVFQRSPSARQTLAWYAEEVTTSPPLRSAARNALQSWGSRP